MPDQLEPIWDGIRDELRRAAPDFKFLIWLEPLRLAGVDGRTLFVRAPEHIRSWVGERYLPLLRQVAARRFDERAVVEIVGADWRPPEAPGTKGSGAADSSPAEARLNPKYTFEQFVIGGGNRFAHAAALAVAEQPAQAYNPLFVHGSPGLGKTHLLHAIGNYVRRYGSGLQVRYATVEQFTSEFVKAIREQRTGAFKERFRAADLVLIDDVQFLARRARTREEFFHTLNALLESGRQLALTSDRPPGDLPGLEARLVERFSAGLVVQLEPPAPQVRRAILAKRARLDGIEVEHAVLDEIARSVSSSVRALEGALIRVVAYASLWGKAPSPALARHVLDRLPSTQRASPCGVDDILAATAEAFNIRREDLLARRRRPRETAARQVAMFLTRELTEHSLPEIGRRIGNRNHTTVLHAVNRVTTQLDSDPQLRAVVDNLCRRLGQPA